MNDKLCIIYESQSFLRLDKFLIEKNIQELYSRSFIEKLILENQITVNNNPVKKSYLLKQGDEIRINVPEPPPTDIVPQDIPLDIVFEDEYLAVINKPAGLIVHPGFGNPDNTLVNAIVFRYGEKFQNEGNQYRPGIVHRLDKGTSGLMLIAKDDKTQSRLSVMFSNRKVKKTYLAITTGIPETNEDKIETFIARSKSNPRKMNVSNEGRLAITHYKVIQYYHYFALLEINLETGRMHQIRVHFANIHRPLLGDVLYNSLKNVHNIVPENMKKKVQELLANHLKRQALHAWKLEFKHPFTSEVLSFEAPIPDDLRYSLDWLEKHFAIDNVAYDRKLIC